jgi:hypothetical protein
MSEEPSVLDHFTDGLRRIEKNCRDASLCEVVRQYRDLMARERYLAISCQSQLFRNEQSQRDSNPCRHLERVVS